MALLNDNSGLPVPRTGFRISRTSEASKRSGDVPTVDNPTAQYTYAPGSTRAGMLNSPGSVTFTDIENGYLVDSYIRQSADKYAEKIVREGFYFTGENQSAVDYVKARLDMMTAAIGEYWMFPLMQAIRDYVRFGNGFLVKARLQKNANIFGQKKKGMRRTSSMQGSTKAPVGGYFAVSPTSIEPVLDSKTNRLTAWKQNVSGQDAVEFELDDIVQLAYNKLSGSIYGISYLLPALDDVRALRQCEEMVLHLIFKSLNPLIHHEVPDTTGTGAGDQVDVDNAAAQHKTMAANGYLITPPNHKIHIIGVESKALRAEGYIAILKHRVYAGLGLSDAIMGEASTISSGASDSFSVIMTDRVKYYQQELSNYFTYAIVWELLQEGGFDPIFNEKDRVYWKFNEVDIDRRIREEANYTQLYQGNVITEDEVRQLLNKPTLADADREKMYLNTVQIPLALSRSQSEAVSGTGNSANNVSPSSQPSTQSPSETTNQSNDMRFVKQVRNSISRFVDAACKSDGAVSSRDIIQQIDKCAAEVSALYGNVSQDAITSARLAAQSAFESTEMPASVARDRLSTFQGWLTARMCH